MTSETDELRAAVAGLLNRRVSCTVAWEEGSGPLVCLSGLLQGMIVVPGGDDAPVSIVIAGQDIVLWPDELDGASVERGPDGRGFSLRLDSGLAISVDRV